MQFSIAILDDDKWYAELLKYNLDLNPEYSVECFSDPNEFLKAAVRFNVLCLDIDLGEMNGEQVMDKMDAKGISIPVVVISGQQEVEVAIRLIQRGAFDYLIKDENTHARLWKTIQNIRDSFELKSTVQKLHKEVGKKYSDDAVLIGEDENLMNVHSLINKAVMADINVSIFGETGTGKEVVAKLLHFKSEVSGPFVAINVASIPSSLMESELFGYEKGAFTGAVGQKKGKFEEANGGTLFLDEIAEMDLQLQAKLLRVLQEREITRLGSNKPIKVNIRLVTATHKNLLKEVEEGRFRQDLYFRIVGLPISLPPLRERGNDVVLLAKHFLKSFLSENSLPSKQLSKEAISTLKKYPFPGNVRELKAVVELAAVISDTPEIMEKDLNLNMQNQLRLDLEADDLSLKDHTIKIIQHYVDVAEGNVVLAAKRLKVGKSTIYRMIQNNEVRI